MRSNKGTQQEEGGQGSDEATSPYPMDITNKGDEGRNKENQQGPTTIREAILAWKEKKQGGAKEKNADEELKTNDRNNKKTSKNATICKEFMCIDQDIWEEKVQYMNIMGEGEAYYVELIQEKEEDVRGKTMEWEQKLALDITNKLNIKRRREEKEVLMIKDKEEEEVEGDHCTQGINERIKKTKGSAELPIALIGWKSRTETNNEKDEEAGLIKPHQAP
ncbi:hypothetical protein PIB30_100109 [Stylosanthes scabra]|uniref:Uncharacterized protein n=1 Tax=Stylosanthes scabra TaxID=79078 RepID=A0ABU6WV86_9FABA|nr:hypothetical protein [Stylosanthes scabra]